MAEIIQFGEKRKETANSAHGAAALAFNTQTVDDWGNQELADLFRVKRLLEQAGVYVETDRGITDEGEPWFVFCHPDGEVFVHLCRIDGQFLLDSTSIDVPLRGTSFTDLINQFVDRAIERRAANIVPLRPGDGVYLHPAIMLTALIWSLFVASDELTGIAHGAEVEAVGPNFDGLVSAHIDDVNDTQGAFGILQAALAEQGDDPVTPKALELEKQLHDPADRELAIQNGNTVHTNAISLSLSAIAVTFGLTSKASFEFLRNKSTDAEIQSEQNFVTSTVSHNERQLENSDREIVVQPNKGEKTSDDGRLAASQDVGQANGVFDVPKGVQLQALDAKGFVTERAMLATSLSADDLQKFVSDVAPRAKTNTQSTAKQPTKQADVAPAETSNDANTTLHVTTAFEFMEGLDLKAYTLDEHEVFATFDLSAAQGQNWLTEVLERGDLKIDTSPDLAGPIQSGTIRATTVTEYSDTAIGFVKYLLSKSDTVELIALKGKIVLVDLSAFDEVSDVSYLRNWVHEDVGIISTIGHLSDFEAFGLVVA